VEEDVVVVVVGGLEDLVLCSHPVVDSLLDD